ncbi:Hypothetical predicted protein, partial [Cloeon dipterum]
VIRALQQRAKSRQKRDLKPIVLNDVNWRDMWYLTSVPAAGRPGTPTSEGTSATGSTASLRGPLSNISPFGPHLFPSFSSSDSSFRPLVDGAAASAGTNRTSANPPPPLFFPPHLTSQFAPPLFPGLKAFPGLCSCCPSMKPSGLHHHGSGLMSSLAAAAAVAQEQEQRSSSVAELRRKAQEHSAALLHSLHHVASIRAQQHTQSAVAAAAVASLHSALQHQQQQHQQQQQQQQQQPMNLHQAMRKSPSGSPPSDAARAAHDASSRPGSPSP